MKRVISLILCLTLTLALFPAGALAADGDTPGTLTTGDITLEGTNSMGSLIANTMDESVLAAASQFCSVTGLEMDGATASLQFHTDRPSRLVVAVYADDEAMQMLGSGSLAVTAEDTAAEVTVSIEAMPEYFVVSAYLMDEETLEPLCDRFVSTMYTRVAQEFLASTVDDYDPERVVSLDGSDDNNFLVFGEDTILTQETAGVNEITDNGDGTYTIRHADESYLALQPGDSFAYTYANGEMLIVLVDSVSVDGDTVTVTAVQEAELGDVFDVIKIDTDSFEAEEEDVSFQPGEHVTLLDESELPAMDGAGMETTSYSHSIAFQLDPWGKLEGEEDEEEEDDDWPFSGSFTLTGIFSVTVRLQIYESTFWDYYALTFENTITGEIKLAGQVTLAEYNLTELAVLLFGGAVKVGATIKFVAEFEASITFSFTISATIGGAYDSDAGFINLCSWPTWDHEITVEGSLFIGLKITPSAKLAGDLAGVSIVGSVGVELSAKKSLLQKQDESSPVYHNCYDSCWDGDVYLKASCTFTVNLIGSILQKSTTLASFKHKLADFYFCFYHDSFEWTTCPFVYYKLTVTILDDLGLPLPGVNVEFTHGEYNDLVAQETTDGAGRVSLHLSSGVYNINFSHGGNSVSRTVEILDSPHSITLFETGADFSTHYAIASGTFGPDKNQNWLLTNTGVLNLSGAGYIYQEDEYPWSEYRSRIKTLIVEDGLANIPSGFCEDYTNLLSVILPESVYTIGEGAFKGCNKLISMILPFIGINRDNSGDIDDVFGHIFGYTEDASVPGTTAQIWSGSGDVRHYYIPQSLRNVTITDESLIGLGAFSNCSMLENISVNDDITSIYDYAFYNCTGLKNFTMPVETSTVQGKAFYNCPGLMAVGPNVRTVYDYAFSGCTGLTTLPQGLNQIGSYAFENCTGFEDITVSAYSIGEGTFKGCDNLVSITLTHIGKYLHSNDSGIEAVFGYIFGYTEESVPGTTAQFCSGSGDVRYFYIPKSLRNVTITDEYVIGLGAFSNCSMLESISINDDISSIYDYAFYNCTGLKNFTMPEETSTVQGKAFYNCPGLMAVGPNVRTVYDYAFSGCTGLTTLPQGLNQIGSYAFANCTGFEDISVSAYSIGEGAFKGCDNLVSITLTHIGKYLHSNDSGIEAVFGYIFGYTEESVPGTTAQIWSNTGDVRYFYIPQTLRNVTITDEYVIGLGAFSNCSMLENISINDDITSIYDYAFYNCTGLKNFTMPEETSTVQGKAFYNCPGLMAVGPNVRTVYDYAFSGCTGLTTLPQGLNQIGSYAFENCTGFEDITVSAYSIGEGAFKGCDNLVSITLTHIGAHHHNNDSGIEAVFGYIFGYTEESVPGTTAQIWSNTGDVRYYYIPQSLRNVTITDESVILCGAFSNCSMLESISINDNITTIGDFAFYNCAGLKNFSMPKETSIVQGKAFYNCPGLMAVGPNVHTVYDYAFSGCTGLTTLPQSLNNIGSYAFENCTSFEDITVSAYSIGEGAFKGCENLVSITLPFIGERKGGSGASEVFGYIFGYAEDESVPGTTTQIWSSPADVRHYYIPQSLRHVTITGESYISTGAFSNCSMLESVSLNDDFTYIYAYAFHGCDNLTDIWYEGTEEKWNSLYIYDHNDALNSAVIHFPEVAADGIPEDAAEPEPTPEAEASPAPGTLPPAESVTDESEPLPGESSEPEPTEVPQTTENLETTAEPEPAESPEPTSEPEPTPEPEAEPVPAAPAELLPVIPAEEIEFVAAYTGVFTMEDTAIATFNDLCPGESYVFLAVKDENADDLTAPDNLLYICQGAADESGTLRIAYTPRKSADAMAVLAFGAAKNRLEDAAFFINYEDVDGTLFYSSMLIHKGTILTEGEDYISHITAHPDGTTTLILTGRDNYSGTVGAMVYAVRFDANSELDAPELQVKNCGDSVTLPAMELAPEGMKLAGWSADPDATEAEYAPGESYTAGQDVTFYAVWVDEYAILRGDVDIDDTLTVRDATQILRHLAKLPSVFGIAEEAEVESARLRAADTDRDGSITDKDAQELLNHILGLPSALDGN